MLNKDIRVSQRIPYELDSLLRKTATKRKTTRAIIVRAALTEYLRKLNKSENPAA